MVTKESVPFDEVCNKLIVGSNIMFTPLCTISSCNNEELSQPKSHVAAITIKIVGC